MSTSHERLRSEILNCNILIIEDDFLSRTVLRGILRKEGFERIYEAENGKDGLSKIEGNPPDIIISDIMMPEMDGLELCRRIHTNPNTIIARIPILVQTGLTHECDKARVFEAGATDYLTKPLEASEVISRCVLHLERSIILRRLQSFNNYLAEERGDPIRKENLEGDFWSFKRLSGAINILLDEIELSHYDLKNAKDRAEKANRMRSEFLASITHDLKTPVHCIQNFAQLGIRAWNKEKMAPLHEYFSDIYDNGQRLDRLINDILDFSKLESGTMEFELKPHSVKRIIAQAIKFTSALSAAAAVHVVVESPLADDLVMLDARRAERVFVNLMTNAIRFSPRDGTITWRFAHHHIVVPGTDIAVPALLITIEDEGPGIDENLLEDIFDPFVQGTQPRKPGSGSGLGLTICRKLLSAFYGTITASNSERGGAIFSISLPFYQPTSH